MLKRYLLPAVLLLAAPAAHANILLSLQSGGPTSDGAGGFNWNYDVLLQPGAQMLPGDATALYDVSGFKSASFTVSTDPITNLPVTDDTFSVSNPALGPTPGFLNPTDTSALPNVVLTLDGPHPVAHPGSVLNLGTLTVGSAFGTAANLDYGSLTHKTSTLPLYAISSVAGPVPEPSTYGFMGIGLAAIAAVALRRARREKK
jgi:hypothetical protein